jgi:3-deoxy-alpha-D-manno-octulosonate 8-oxidase
MKTLKHVPRILFQPGAINMLDELIDELKLKEGYKIILIDDVHKEKDFVKKIKLKEKDYILFISADEEPKTKLVDLITTEIKNKTDKLPILIVGIGGGSIMDIAKSISIMLTNEGPSTNYQGWDLVKNKPITKIGIPTLSGTGSEATKTAILTGPTKKMGINSKYSMFDGILLDPQLTKTVSPDQRFYTAMDCYIHCTESINGNFLNNLVKPFVEKGLENCRKIFLKEDFSDEDGELLMIASYLGGLSVTNSEVGICHALSYGISLILGYHHGLANCIVFNQLEEFYPKEVTEFKEMLIKHKIELPKNITKYLSENEISKMVEMAFKMERPLTNALGSNWKEILTREKIIELYKRM